MKELIHRNCLKLTKYLFGLLIAGFICWGFVSFSKDDNWLAVSALATLILAVAAFMTIRNSNEREKRRREEDERIRDEERERDFKRRCLSDIEDWAEKSIIFLNRPETHFGHTTEWYKSALQPFTIKSKWMMDASRVFAKDDKKALLKTVDKTVTNLEEYRTGITVRDITSKHEELVSSLNKVLACIADLKVKLKV